LTTSSWNLVRVKWELVCGRVTGVSMSNIQS
jgi:hypothetical protein